LKWGGHGRIVARFAEEKHVNCRSENVQ
jgi:hypothetical protein